MEPHPTESDVLQNYVGLRSIKMTVLFAQLFHYALLKGQERDCLTCFQFVCFPSLGKSSAQETTNVTDSTDLNEEGVMTKRDSSVGEW